MLHTEQNMSKQIFYIKIEGKKNKKLKGHKTEQSV